MALTDPLTGMSILLTRPAKQSAGVAAAISAAGGNVCHLPLLEIEPITQPEDIAHVKARIMNLDRYQIAIFISTNAAALGIEWIERYWPQLPVGLAAFAVGPGTAAVLRQLPWPVFCSDQGVTSEDLLALPQLNDIHGKRIALFRGQGGRQLLAETLRKRGADVEYLELYRRRTPDYTENTVGALIEREGVTAIVVTSAQILEVLLHLMGDSAEHRELPVIVPSERVEVLAREAGFTDVINAGGASDEAIIQALLQLQDNVTSGVSDD